MENLSLSGKCGYASVPALVVLRGSMKMILMTMEEMEHTGQGRDGGAKEKGPDTAIGGIVAIQALHRPAKQEALVQGHHLEE